MTTKTKIISGFSLLIILLVVLAVISYRGLHASALNLDRVNTLSVFNVLLSDMNTDMTNTALRAETFLGSGQEEHRAAVLESLKATRDKAVRARGFVTREDTRALVDEINAELDSYEKAFEAASSGHMRVLKLYEDEFVPATESLVSQLQSSVKVAATANNTAAVERLTNLWLQAGTAQFDVATYINGRKLDFANHAVQSLAELDKERQGLADGAVTMEGRNLSNLINTSVQNARRAFDGLYELSTANLGNIGSLGEIQGMILANIDTLNGLVDTQMTQYNADATANVSNTETQLIILSVAGVVIGAAFALFIILGLIRVLTRVSGFATAIANGRFDHDPQVKEGGEIGAMVEGIKQIPAILKDIVGTSNSIANNISSGKYRSRLDIAALNGDFQDLGNAINTISDAYTSAFDNLPISVVTVDPERKLQFLNKQAQAVAGGDAVGDFCGDKLGAEECKDTKSCFSCRTKESGQPASGEVTVNADGNRMDFALSNSPLYDLAGNHAGSMEIMSDITQIKAQEITMRRVANNASDISDRVAAAAEELAAQVEQVSRGAEMQREQMETTASAMTEMNSTVLEVANNAAQASEQSEQTRSNAESGATLVNQVVQAIREVNDVALTLQRNMEELGKQAENIGGVMNVITDIADQTNLLALNAAIEAARAGDAGRGFAVVADSVRNLAEKTMTATQEVGGSITAIQQATKVNISEVENAVSSVQKATELANSSGTALEQIVELTSTTSQVVASIATAAEEQSATSEEITRTVDQVNVIVGETADGMVQSSAAVQDLSRQAQDLRRVLEELS